MKFDNNCYHKIRAIDDATMYKRLKAIQKMKICRVTNEKKVMSINKAYFIYI